MKFRILGLVLLAALSINTSSSDDTVRLYDEGQFVEFCSIVSGRITKSNYQYRYGQIRTTCECIDSYIKKNDITHHGLTTDLVLSAFIDMEYYIPHDGLSTQYQFDHVTDVKLACPIE